MNYLKIIVFTLLLNFTNAFYWSVKIDKTPTNYNKKWMHIDIIEPNFNKSTTINECFNIAIEDKDYDKAPYATCDYKKYPAIKIKLNNETKEFEYLYSEDKIYECYIMNYNINFTSYACNNN